MPTLPILTLDAAEELLEALDDFLEKAEASYALVIDRGGIILSQHGQVPTATDPSIIAALAAGSFAATHELALRVGESDCTALYQQGSQSHILISSIDSDIVLVTVFDNQSTVGLVKFYAKRAIEDIRQVLDRASTKPRPRGPFSTADLERAGNLFG